MLQLISFKNKNQTLDSLSKCLNNVDVYEALTCKACNDYNSTDIKIPEDFKSQNGYGYDEGDYFIYYGSGAKKHDERMIINLSSQKDALDIAVQLKKSDISLDVKFYACSSSVHFDYGKCDKVVIYYNKMDRNAIYNQVLATNVAETNFLKDLSAFYDIYERVPNGGYYVGIAPETDPETSYSEQNAVCIHEGINQGITHAQGLFNYWCKKNGFNVEI